MLVTFAGFGGCQLCGGARFGPVWSYRTDNAETNRDISSLTPEDFTKCISMAYAIDCQLEGRAPEPDSAKPVREHKFPERTDVFEPFILALQSGSIRSKGFFSVVDLDLPALEGDISERDVGLSCAAWRKRGDIRLGCGSETKATDIPTSAWWYEGAIWERSTLWISDQAAFESRRNGLVIERLIPSLPERPYGFERTLCFLDVQLSLDDLKAWMSTKSISSASGKKPNERGAGMKPTEDYDAITEHLKKLIAEGKEWKSWRWVWEDVRDFFRNPSERDGSDQPSKKLEQHLSAHEPEFYDTLRGRILTVKNRRK